MVPKRKRRRRKLVSGTRPKAARKHAATRPNAKRGAKSVLKDSGRRTRDTVASTVTREDKRPAWQLTSVTNNVPRKRMARQGKVMIRIEQPVKLTARNFPYWNSFSVTLDEFVGYSKQGTDFSKCICTLYTEYA